MNQKGFSPLIIILGIILAIGIAGGAYYFGKSQSIKPAAVPSPNPVVTSQTPQPTAISQATSIPSLIPSATPAETANWKTYTNKDYGFSFKYPPQFIITETEEKPVFQDQHNEPINMYTLSFSTGKVLPNGGNNTIQDFSGFSIDVGSNNGMTIDQYYKGLTQNGDPWIIKHLTPYGNAIEAADIVCYSCNNTTERFGKYFYSIIPFQNAAVLPDGSDDIWKYMNQILSTFKFTQ